MSPAQLAIELPSVPASVVAARRAVERLALDHGACEGAVQAVRLAVSEACTNVVLHAYPDGSPGALRVEAAARDGVLRIAVCDFGQGMRPRPDSPGLGLGLPLISAVAADVRVDRAAGAVTRVRMSFPLDAPPSVFAATG